MIQAGEVGHTSHIDTSSRFYLMVIIIPIKSYENTVIDECPSPSLSSHWIASRSQSYPQELMKSSSPGTPSYSAGSWWHLSPHTFHRHAPNLARMWYLCVLQQPVGVEAPLKGGLFRVERWGENGMSSLATGEAEKSTLLNHRKQKIPK